MDKEKLLEIMNGEGEADAKADTLLNLIQSNIDEQLNAIKMNREAVKNEKTEEIAKRRAAEEQVKALSEKNATLEKQLASSSPDEIKKIYEQKAQEAANLYERQRQEKDASIEELKLKITSLERDKLKFDCMQEFNAAISDMNIATDARNDFAEYVLGYDCAKFDYRPLGDGKQILATKEGLTIKAACEAAKDSTFGKRCVVVNSYGGGAEGGSSADVLTGTNPFKKETWNLTKQSELYNKDPALYAKMKAAAGV